MKPKNSNCFIFIISFICSSVYQPSVYNFKWADPRIWLLLWIFKLLIPDTCDNLNGLWSMYFIVYSWLDWMLNKYLRLNLHFLSPLVLVLMLFKYINMYENETQNKKKRKEQEMFQKHICPPWCKIQVYLLCRSKICPKQVSKGLKYI